MPSHILIIDDDTSVLEMMRYTVKNIKEYLPLLLETARIEEKDEIKVKERQCKEIVESFSLFEEQHEKIQEALRKFNSK